MKLVFAGAYGIRSQGDDAALIAIVEQLRARNIPLKGKVICRHAGERPYEAYGLESVQNIEYDSREQSEGRWFRGFNYGDDPSELESIREAIGASDGLVLGAGNFLIDTTRELFRGPVSYFIILTVLARLERIPVMWYGISAGPLISTHSKKAVRFAAEMASVITVRDRSSEEVLRDLGYEGRIHLLPDPVLGLNRVVPETDAPHEAPRIVVSVRGIPDGCGLPHERYVKAMGRLLDTLVESHGVECIFVPQCTYEHARALDDDRSVARQVVDGMIHSDRCTVVDDHLSITDCLALYADADMAVCTRLHANVYAAIEGVPSVALSYNPKVSGFMQSVGALDRTVGLAELETPRAVDVCRETFLNREKIAGTLKSVVAEHRKHLSTYGDLILDLVQP